MCKEENIKILPVELVDGRGVWMKPGDIAMVGNFKHGREHGNFISVDVNGQLGSWTATTPNIEDE